MAPGILGLPWALWGGLALAVAGVFTLVAPRSSGTTGLRFVVLRWFHPATWLLLAFSAVIHGFFAGASRPADLVAQVALATYAIFLLTFIRARRHHRPEPVR